VSIIGYHDRLQLGTKQRPVFGSAQQGRADSTATDNNGNNNNNDNDNGNGDINLQVTVVDNQCCHRRTT